MKNCFDNAKKYSVRKFSIGVASIIVGSIVYLGTSNEAFASENSSNMSVSTQTAQTSDSLENNSKSIEEVTPKQNKEGAEEASKPQEQTGVTKEEASKPQEQTGVAKEEASKPQEQTEVAKEEASKPQEQTEVAKEEASKPQEQTESAKEEAKPQEQLEVTNKKETKSKNKLEDKDSLSNGQQINHVHNPLKRTKTLNMQKSSNKTATLKNKTKSITTYTKKATKNYVVKSGDTLSGIAVKFKTTVKELQSLNKIANADAIQIGQVIKVPVDSSSKPSKPSGSTSGVMKYLKTLEGKGWDFDNQYGWQCFDLVNVYWNKLYGHGLKGVGAKDIPNVNNFSGEAKVYKNTPSFKAQPGDLAVFGSNYGEGYGHVSIVTNGNYDGNLMQFESLDQNWRGGGSNKTEVAHRVVHAYESNMYFIRPYKKL
ncbi:LysM peptidoglycan-binding domain-containing protein [Staphylococcus caprae]|nr:LysM peptidoglycan-binding domain-containing protein [Staphylococcus caprae]RIM33576.1 LysM peptidoglycan-binding domain-containing protein [Staphylococcus caprae]